MTNGNSLEDVTPDDLVEMLVRAHGVESAEHLSGRSAIPLRTLRRWQAEGYPVWWGKAVQLIRELGLLRPVSGDEVGHDADLADALVVLVQSQEQVLDDLRQVQQRLGNGAAAQRRRPVRPIRSVPSE